MKVFLLHQDRDFDPERRAAVERGRPGAGPRAGHALAAMAQGDAFLRAVAKQALLSQPLTILRPLLYRQAVLRDCLEQPRDRPGRSTRSRSRRSRRERKAVLRRLRATVADRDPAPIGRRAADVRRGAEAAPAHRRRARRRTFARRASPRLFAMLEAELDDDYFDEGRQSTCSELRFRRGIADQRRARQGQHRGRATCCASRTARRTGWTRLLGARPPSFTASRSTDATSAAPRALAELRERGINLVANALAQSADHILSFFAHAAHRARPSISAA